MLKLAERERKEKAGEYRMEFMDKQLEDIVVTLPFADGTSMDCGVYSYFEVNDKKYFALLPLKGEKNWIFPTAICFMRCRKMRSIIPWLCI